MLSRNQTKYILGLIRSQATLALDNRNNPRSVANHALLIEELISATMDMLDNRHQHEAEDINATTSAALRNADRRLNEIMPMVWGPVEDNLLDLLSRKEEQQ